MSAMANRACLSIWCSDFSEELALKQIATFLGTVPFSQSKPGFTHLTLRALEPSEWPLLEMDLRTAPFDAAGIVEVAKDHWQSDCSCEVECAWDLWAWDGATDRWKLDP